MSDLPEPLNRARAAAHNAARTTGPQNAIRATSPASPYARDRIEAPSNRPAPRAPTLRSRAQDVIRAAPGALTAARERSVYDTTPQGLVRGAQELTGLPSLARGAGALAALPALARSGFLGPQHALPAAGALAETALGLAGPMSLPRGAARVSRSVPLTQQYGSADTFESGPFSALYFNASPNRVNLLEMGTDSSARGQGHARRGMQEFLRSHGNRDIYLTPSPTEPPYDVARLEGFYRSLGFEPVPGDADMFAWRRLGANPAETAQRIPNMAREIGPNGALRAPSASAAQRMPLSRLEEFDPIDGMRPWDLQGQSLEDETVMAALNSRRLKAEPYTDGANWTAQDHAERIAWLIKNGGDDPITLTRDADGLGIEDGYHRLAAARLRGDRDIPVRFAAPTEAAQRIARPAREIGPNGMPVAQSQPTRNSFRGGSSDLREAAGRVAAPAADISRPISAGTLDGRTFYRGQGGDIQGGGSFRRNSHISANPETANNYATMNLSGAERAPTVFPLRGTGRIADRDGVMSVVDELVAGGMSREEALRQAIPELERRGFAGFQMARRGDPEFDDDIQIFNPSANLRSAFDAEPAQRIPNMAREIGPNGMPVAQSQPTRNSFRGGSSDLREAAGMRADLEAPPQVFEAFHNSPRGGIQRLRSNRSGSVQSHGRGVYLGTETPNDSWGQHAYRVQVRGRREDFPQMWSPLSSRDGLLERFQQAGQGRRVEFTPDMHVDNAYQRLADAMPGWTEKARELAASRALARAGVPGIAGDFTRPQIVVFDDGALSIVERAKGAPRHWRADTGALDDGIPPVSDYPVAPPPTTPTGTAPFGDPRAYPPQAWEEFGSLQGGTPEARLRAQEQGWDARGYHATTADIQGGMRPSLSGELGPGVYVARQPKTTETYIGGSIWNDFDATPPSRPQQFFEGANIMPIVTRGKIATREQLDAAQEAARKRMRRRYRDDQDVQQAAADDLRAQGYTGASDPSRDFTVMFADPDGQVRNIRSVNAAFDSARRNDPDILAGLTAATPIPIAAHALTQQQNTTGRPRGRPSDSQRSRGAFDRAGR